MLGDAKNGNRNGRAERVLWPVGIAFVVLLFSVMTSDVAAQEPAADTAPPPVRTITREDRVQLDATRNIGDRTKLTLRLMENKLAAAERLHAAAGFEEMFRELGGFHALMNDGLAFLARGNQRSGTVLDNYKRLDLGLRKFSARIEVLRREIPVRYDDYIHRLSRYVRDARTRATEPLFGDTVIPERKPTL